MKTASPLFVNCKWSSYLVYLGKNKKSQWVETDYTLRHFGSTITRSRRNFRKFIEEGITNKLENPTKNTIAGTILGDESFVNWIKNKFLSDKPFDSERPAIRKLRKTLSLQKIIHETSNVFNVNAKDIVKKGSHGNIAREVSVYLSKRFCGLKNVELGKEFGGITGANVSYVCKKVDTLLIKDRMLRKTVSKISENLNYNV